MPLEIDEHALKAARKRRKVARLSWYTDKERADRVNAWIEKLELKSTSAFLDQAADFFCSALEEHEAKKKAAEKPDAKRGGAGK